jgi:hypothetical protein
MTATLPCLRIQRAKRGSVFSSASAKSLVRHQARWNGQYDCGGRKCDAASAAVE